MLRAEPDTRATTPPAFNGASFFGALHTGIGGGFAGDVLDAVESGDNDTARKLVGMFQKNFTKYEQHVDAEVRAAAPEVRIAAE